jgi:hypothetical protein
VDAAKTVMADRPRGVKYVYRMISKRGVERFAQYNSKQTLGAVLGMKPQTGADDGHSSGGLFA